MTMELIDIVKVLSTFITTFFIWYAYDRYQWFATVIYKNPKSASLTPVYTKKTEKQEKRYRKPDEKIIAPQANFRQYLKYLKLACLPYTWTVPFKVLKQIYMRQFKSKLTEHERRQRLAKMILETSLTLGFKEKLENADEGSKFLFNFQKFRIPSKVEDVPTSSTFKGIQNSRYYFVNNCDIEILLDEQEEPYLNQLIIDDKNMEDLNEMFSFLNTLWCVYTHTMTHVLAGSIADDNINNIKNRDDLPDDIKESIDDMHAVVSGMNESANHYPADIWGIPRQNLQVVLGYNATQQIGNHMSIVQCYQISNFIRFIMKARKVFTKYLKDTNVSISTISANTIFHSIDHYNMGKYFLHDQEKKTFLGIDSRMITSLLGDLNFDFGHWQGMKYTKYATWQKIYEELREIDAELADKTHMFVSV